MTLTYPSRIARALFTLSLCVVFPGFGKCQTLTAADLLSSIGTAYLQYGITDFLPWDTLQGNGVLWNYDWITVDSANGSIFEAIDPADAPDLALYPGADRVVRDISGTNNDYVIDHFYDMQADRVLELGSVGPVLSYAYDTPGTQYPFPIQLGDTVHDTYCFWSDGLGSQFHFCGATYVTFDAMGTLVLPYGTYTDVKHVTSWESSFETTQPATDSTYSVRQQWFAPGIPFALLDVSIFISDGQWYPGGRLTDAASLTAVPERLDEVSWSVFPNPTSDLITVQRSTTGKAMIEVSTLDGRVVRTASLPIGAAQGTISLADLADGVYVVRSLGEDGTRSLRVQKVTPH